MASTGKKGKKNKGKTVPLNDFLSNNTISWIDQVDEADKAGEFNRKPALPAAPRAARALELDESRIPKNPPYVAYLSNLSYELEEVDILNAFSDLSISNVRLPVDDRSGRLKGFGYVEFSDRGSFISALQKHEATIRGRRIKIDVAENEGERRRGGMKDNRDRDSNYESEKTLGDWRSGPRSEFATNDDRRGPASGRKEYGGFRDRDRDRDRDGIDRNRGGDRDSSWRNNERSDRERDSRSSYGSRRGYNDSENNYSEPKTRTKLNLKPRTKPIEELVVKEEPIKKERPEKEKPSAASIFGQAKPVDTAAREREIEERLAKERVGNKSDKDANVSKSSDGENSGSETKGVTSVLKENVWAKKSIKSEAENLTSRRLSSEKTNDLDEPPPAEKSEKEIPEDSLDSSQYSENRRSDDCDSDGDNRYSRHSKNESRYNDRNRDSDKSYRRDERDRRDRRDERRDRGYDSDRRGGSSAGRNDQDRDGDSKRFSERDNDHRRFTNDREGDSKRFQEREIGRHRELDDHGNKGPRGERRGGPSVGDKIKTKSTQERERGPQSKEKPKDQRKSEDGIKMPKFKEAEAPNYIGTNKYSFLEEDGVSE